MSTAPEQGRWSREEYERAALKYWASLPAEHTMEATTQSVQREVVNASMALVRRRHPRLWYFNELLVQKFHQGQLIQVVPDTMVVLGDLQEQQRTCYLPEEEGPLFWTLEYVSPSNPYGDYTEKRQLYEQVLKVPYYLIHDVEAAPLVLCLYRHDGQAYQIVPRNSHGRYPIPELKLEIGLIDGWSRLWLEGQLLELPTELANRVDNLTRENERLLQTNTKLEQLIRGVVESKARLAGRQDILAALPATSDADTLARWLAELG